MTGFAQQPGILLFLSGGLRLFFSGLQGPVQIPDWLWFVLPSSLVVALILLLLAAILVLLFIMWRRARRNRAALPVPLPVAAPPAPEQVTSVYDPELAKTQPSPVTRPVPETMVLAPEAEPATLPESGQRVAGVAWQIAALTDVGRKRELNEDTFLMLETVLADNTPAGLYIVADGLGGHQGGEVASRITAETIRRHFTQHPPIPANTPFEGWLKEAAMAANQAVLARQQDPEQVKKMGSTLVMALVTAGKAFIANVGDSRAYYLEPERITQISVDHSLVERLVQIGQLTREEARTHKNRNVVYNTIGDRPEMEVSLYQVDLPPGHRLLLCSDGLSGMITDEQIQSISRHQPNPAKACQMLVRAAKSAGGKDNITVVIVQMD